MSKSLCTVLLMSLAVAEDVPEYISLKADDFTGEVQAIVHRQLSAPPQSLKTREGTTHPIQFLASFDKSNDTWVINLTIRAENFGVDTKDGSGITRFAYKWGKNYTDINDLTNDRNSGFDKEAKLMWLVTDESALVVLQRSNASKFLEACASKETVSIRIETERQKITFDMPEKVQSSYREFYEYVKRYTSETGIKIEE